jgi:uncharacterized protein (TIGR00255 family)
MSCKSMTGFGQSVLESSELFLKAEIRAVNHRFIEFNIRMPREFFELEEVVRNHLSQFLVRGHIDVYLSVDLAKFSSQVVVNWDVVDGFVAAEKEAGMRYGFALPQSADFRTLFMHEKAVSVETVPLEVRSYREQVLQVIDEAVTKLVAMRMREGNRIRTDMQSKLNVLMQLVQGIGERDRAASDIHLHRLQKRISELQVEVEEARLWTEVALVVDRFAVDEEVVRLLSHIDEFKRALDSDGPIGRRLDFIVQELHREVNTIGSKSQDLQISRAVVDAKVIVEQLREQAQNIE